MSTLIPLATYNLNLQPFNPVPAIEDDFPVTIRITLASLDPEAADDKAEPSTLRILKKSNDFLDDDDLADLADLEAEEDDDEEEEDELDETPKKLNGKKNADEDDEDSDEDDEDDEDGDIEEYVVCTLSPKTQYQQTLDLTITPSEEVYFVVTGSYPIHLTGNYVEHPADETDSEEEDDEYDEDEYDLTPDEDEIIYGAPFDDDEIDEDDSEEDNDESTPKIEQIEDEEEEEEAVAKKRPAEEPTSKKSKKAKKNEKKEEKKSVQFTKELEQGPTGSTLVEKKEEKKAEKKAEKKEKNGDKKFPTKTLLGGVITEDRKVGSGPLAKSGSKVGIRYIGKLKNGSVFDKNTTGKPFTFKLGKGECIKGFDLGVAGMAVGGERRVIIPPKMGYGSQALPGIPANSELTFDIKLISLK
ncbi:hypothetical protein Cantr_04938 [Candida viswanathii]|uniref:FK506-binding protein n=1 Tax=Candida viswanathii TaxID=5486 RepID=A0A367XSK9_9ASCO|nr:hypothetical protein Cantr_04938 [Candida viswanathii]